MEGFFHVWRYTIEYRTRLDRNIHVRDVADLRGTVRFCEDGFAQVPSNLLLVHLERSNEGNVLDFVGSETGMHEAGCETVLSRRVLPVILYPLDECAGTISNPGECDLDLSNHQNNLSAEYSKAAVL